MLLIMNYLQWGVYEQRIGCVKTVEPRTKTASFGVFAFLTKTNIDLRYDNSVCVSEAWDLFLLSFVLAVYYTSEWVSEALLITSL